MARAVPQNDLQGVVVPGGKRNAVVGAIREPADAQQELGPVGRACGGQGPLAQIQQGRAVVKDEGPGVLIGSGGLEKGQQSIPDPELHGLVPGAVAVGQNVEPQHLLRLGRG